MAIAIGQHAVAATVPFTPETSITTPAKTTSATGSTFVISVLSNTAIAGTTPVQDSYSNSYTLKSSATTVFGSIYVYQYLCDGGSGGSGHTATATLSASGQVACFFTEVTGAANPSYDSSGTINNTGGGASQSGASVTTANAADLLLSLIGTNGDGATITDSSGWSQMLDTIGQSGSATAGVSYIVESSTGTYQDTYGISSNGATGGSIIALKQATGGGGVSGSAAITEGSDTVNASGTVQVQGTSAITESSDVVNASGTVQVQGTSAITESSDIVNASGTVQVQGTSALTESSDIVNASGNAGGGGVAAITESSDVVNASGTVSVSGAAAITEGHDIVTASGIAGSGGPVTLPNDPGFLVNIGFLGLRR